MKIFLLLFPLLIFISCDSLNNKYVDDKREKNINRPAFELKYPASWNIDTLDTDYDIDSYFSIVAPVDDRVSIFVIYNTSINEQEHVSAQVKLI